MLVYTAAVLALALIVALYLYVAREDRRLEGLDEDFAPELVDEIPRRARAHTTRSDRWT